MHILSRQSQVNLFEFGVIGPAHVFTAISRLQVVSTSAVTSFENILLRPSFHCFDFSGDGSQPWSTARLILGRTHHIAQVFISLALLFHKSHHHGHIVETIAVMILTS